MEVQIFVCEVTQRLLSRISRNQWYPGFQSHEKEADYL